MLIGHRLLSHACRGAENWTQMYPWIEANRVAMGLMVDKRLPDCRLSIGHFDRRALARAGQPSPGYGCPRKISSIWSPILGAGMLPDLCDPTRCASAGRPCGSFPMRAHSNSRNC